MVEQWVKDLCEGIETISGNQHPQIGERWVYRGQPVEITGGQYWGTYGLSNHWRFSFETGALGSAHDNNRAIFHPDWATVEPQEYPDY